VCHKPPWPKVDGGTVATARMVEGLAASGIEVNVVALSTPKHPGVGRAPGGIVMETIPVDTRPRVVPALANLTRKGSYQLERFFTPQVHHFVTERVRDFRPDIVQLDGVGVLPCLADLRSVFSGVVVYRAHNVEHQIIRDRSMASRKRLARWWLSLQAIRLEKEETAACRAVDGVVAISEPVAAWCRRRTHRPVTVIGVGVSVGDDPPLPPHAGDLVHLGAMDWPPNREWVTWFVDEVWPEIRRRHPGLEFHLAGRRSEPFGKKISGPGVVIDGEIDSVEEYLAGRGLMVVPLLSGSGIRVKIVEGMALGKAIVATPCAIEGLGVEPGRHLLVAEDRRQWVETIDRCLSQTGLVASLGSAARSFAEEHFSLPKFTRDLESFYTALTKSTQ